MVLRTVGNPHVSRFCEPSVALCGLVVSMLAVGLKVCGFIPCR
jgi:hypothetical protein